MRIQVETEKTPAAPVFARAPENDFAHYIRTYYEKCRSYFDRIEAIAGKWMFRDLVPGMSDFDVRLIVSDGMTADDWCRMSTAIGQAHLELSQKYACWARNLEHLPGVNLTWSELTSEKTYYPECQQWSFYCSESSQKLSAAQKSLAQRPWDAKDEYFHLKRFCTYYGRYNRAIDPPVNLGVHESKYPLHSRLMHYFTPAVQAAISLLERRNIAGKFDALEIAQRHFPNLKCWGIINEIFCADYRIPKWYSEPFLSDLEDELETTLQAISTSLRDSLSVIPEHVEPDVGAWKAVLEQASVDPVTTIFENARFSRLMKGRLQFYAKAPPHFATSWLIGNELKRIGRSFFRVPFSVYWKIRTGERINDPFTILGRLSGEPLTPAEVEATREFARWTSGEWVPGREKAIALSIADVFDDFFKALTKISETVYESEVADAAQ